MSAHELERMTRRFTLAISHVLGVNRDIPAPDMNTNAQVMAWMMDAYSVAHGYSPAIVTGKPVDLGGAPGREAATGRGRRVRARGRVRALGHRPRRAARSPSRASATSARGRPRELHDRGVKVVAVSDVSGGVVQPERASTSRRSSSWAATRRPLTDVEGGVDAITNEELLELDCDVLIPAALGEVIHGDNADDVRAKIVVEAANHPTTPEADKILDGPRRAGDPRHPRQRRRRDRLVLRVGAEHPAVPLEGGPLQRRAAATRWSAPSTPPPPSPSAATCSMRRAAFAIGIERVAKAAKLRGYV